MELIIQDVVKKFGDKLVLDSASFTFEKGKIYGLLGRNGAGKTTLFNCISKDLPIDAGEIIISEHGVNHQFTDLEVGLVHATPTVPDFMTGYEFIKFFIDMNEEKMLNVRTPDEYLAKVGIKKEDRHRLLKDYSHGMKNKVQMIATMMVQPPVLLLDEPLTSFDVVAAHEMKELIISMKKDSVVIFSTHILQLAQDLCDEIVVLHNGKLTGFDPSKIHTNSFEADIVSLLSKDDSNTQHVVEEIIIGEHDDE